MRPFAFLFIFFINFKKLQFLYHLYHFCMLALHILQKLGLPSERHKLFIHCNTITEDEFLPAVDQEQAPYVAESCHVVCFQSVGSGPLVIKVQETANIFKSLN